jgi:hypothetical protein
MIEETLISSLVSALMEEGEIDLDEEADRYAAESLNTDEDEEISEPDIQYRTEEALNIALQTFFNTLPESVQEEIEHAIRQFSIRPDKSALATWHKMGGN